MLQCTEEKFLFKISVFLERCVLRSAALFNVYDFLQTWNVVAITSVIQNCRYKLLRQLSNFDKKKAKRHSSCCAIFFPLKLAKVSTNILLDSKLCLCKFEFFVFFSLCACMILMKLKYIFSNKFVAASKAFYEYDVLYFRACLCELNSDNECG